MAAKDAPGNKNRLARAGHSGASWHAMMLAAAVATGAAMPRAGASEPAGDPAAGPPAGENVILSARGYWRVYSQFAMDQVSPAALAAEGEKILNPKWLERRKKEADWKDRVFMYSYNEFFSAAHPPPPGDWMSPEFDDSVWLKVKDAATAGCMRRRACYLRARFEIPDPVKAGELTLKVACRGGARVFVNGQELARGHLPEGVLSADTPALDYPAEAYALLLDEWPPHWKTRIKDYDWQKTPIFCPDLPARFEDAAVTHKAEGDIPEFRGSGWTNGRESIYSQKSWQRIKTLRDRELGPLKVPVNLLRKGANVLAIEVRTSRLHPIALNQNPRFPNDEFGWSSFTWSHGNLQAVELRTSSPSVSSALARPEGVQVWVEDMHYRVHAPEFLPRGEPMGAIRLVGVPNGTYSAQLAVGSSRALTALKVSLSDLKPADAPGTGSIPAAAGRAFFMTPQPLTQLGPLARSRGAFHPGFVSEMGRVELARHIAAPLPFLPDNQLVKELEKMTYFDQLGETAPEQIAAASCQAIWLSWKIPADAPPGRYKGSVRIEGQGMEPASIPVEAEVIGWRLPDPKDFQTIVTIEHSPYGVAKQYKTPLWSDEHFKRLEASVRQLSRVGNDFLLIPARNGMDFGNGPDTIIKWIRKKDGTLSFDYAVLDRYLELVVRHWGTPRYICFEIQTTGDKADLVAPVGILDEATGKTVLQPLGGPGGVTDEEFKKLWRAFAGSLYEHLKSKGLEKSMYWWYGADSGFDEKLRTVLTEAAPEVYFFLASHAVDGVGGGRVRVATCIYYGVDGKGHDGKGNGWKREPVRLSTPRWGNTVYCVNGDSNPFAFRVTLDRTLSCGYNGSGRMAADYWNSNFFDLRQWTYQPGYSVGDLFYPGREGAESSARYEAFLEGLQEAEARIFIEQAIERGKLPKDLVARAEQILQGKHTHLSFLPCWGAAFPENEYHNGWQDRSRKVFQLAAEVAQASGQDASGDKKSK